MTDKDKLLRKYAIAVKNAQANEKIAEAHRADAHRLLRELHGVPVGTVWRVRVKPGMFSNRTGYDAVLQDIRPISYYSRPEDKPWATGFRLKKDGTPEQSARQLYSDWEVIGPYEAPK